MCIVVTSGQYQEAVGVCVCEGVDVCGVRGLCVYVWGLYLSFQKIVEIESTEFELWQLKESAP